MEIDDEKEEYILPSNFGQDEILYMLNEGFTEYEGLNLYALFREKNKEVVVKNILERGLFKDVCFYSVIRYSSFPFMQYLLQNLYPRFLECFKVNESGKIENSWKDSKTLFKILIYRGDLDVLLYFINGGLNKPSDLYSVIHADKLTYNSICCLFRIGYKPDDISPFVLMLMERVEDNRFEKLLNMGGYSFSQFHVTYESKWFTNYKDDTMFEKIVDMIIRYGPPQGKCTTDIYADLLYVYRIDLFNKLVEHVHPNESCLEDIYCLTESAEDYPPLVENKEGIYVEEESRLEEEAKDILISKYTKEEIEEILFKFKEWRKKTFET